jgi:hypothetical protein
MTTNEEDFLNRKKNMCLNSLKNKKYSNSVKRKLDNVAFVINDEKNNRYLFGDKSNHRIKYVSYVNGETQDEVTTKFVDSEYENLSIKEQLKILTPKNYKSLYNCEIDHAWHGYDRFYGVSLGKLFTIDNGIESVSSLYKLHGFGDDSTDKMKGLKNTGMYISNEVYSTYNLINTDKLINLYKNTNNIFTSLAINNVNSVGYFDNLSKSSDPIEMLKATGVRLLLWKEGYKNSCNITMEFCTTSVPKYITITSNKDSSEYKSNEDRKMFGFPGKLRRGFTSYKNYTEGRYANDPVSKTVIGGSYLDAIKIGTASQFNYISILPTYSSKITKLPYINDLTSLTYDETVAYSESSYAPFDTLVEDM